MAGQQAQLMPLLTALLGANSLAITLHEASRLDRVGSAIMPDTEAAVIYISDQDSAPELRILMQRFPDVGFLLVTAETPPRRALARAARENGAAVVSVDDGRLVGAATLFSMLAQRKVAGGSSS